MALATARRAVKELLSGQRVALSLLKNRRDLFGSRIELSFIIRGLSELRVKFTPAPGFLSEADAEHA